MKADGRYIRIKSKFWTDEKARLWNIETKYLALYLLTCPHNNILGCYVLPKLYICADLGWEPNQLSKPFNQLISDGFIKYDDSNCLILLCQFLKHNPIENHNQVTAAIKQLKELPNSPLLQDLKQLIERLNKPFLKPLAEQISKPVTVTVTVTASVNNTCAPSSAPECSETPAENLSLFIEEVKGAQDETYADPGKGTEYPADFEEFWAAYPRQKEKKAGFACWKARKKEGHLPRDMLAAAKAYAVECRQKATEEQYIKQSKTFLGSKLPFLEYVPDGEAVELDASRFKKDDYTG